MDIYTKKSNLITITGSLEDLYYYKKRIISLFKDDFGVTPSLKKRNDSNSYYLMIYSKGIMAFLTEKIRLKRESKVNASIPKIFFRSKILALAFLRDLFDTNGCIKFSKQSKEMNYYPRVQIALRISPLASELGKLIKLNGFHYGTWIESRFSGIIF
jgi:hypothetical protein